MELSKIMKFPTLRHCQGNGCLQYGFHRSRFLHFLFFCKVAFHSRKISCKCSGLALCDRIDVNFYAANRKIVLVKGIKQIIFVFSALVFHNDVKIGTSLLQPPAPASGYHHIYKVYVYLIFINLGLQICPYGLLYIVLCLSVDTVKQFLCPCLEISNDPAVFCFRHFRLDTLI